MWTGVFVFVNEKYVTGQYRWFIYELFSEYIGHNFRFKFFFMTWIENSTEMKRYDRVNRTKFIWTLSYKYSLERYSKGIWQNRMLRNFTIANRIHSNDNQRILMNSVADRRPKSQFYRIRFFEFWFRMNKNSLLPLALYNWFGIYFKDFN